MWECYDIDSRLSEVKLHRNKGKIIAATVRKGDRARWEGSVGSSSEILNLCIDSFGPSRNDH